MLVHKLASMQREQGENEERGRPLQMGRLNKQENKDCLGCTPRILKGEQVALTGFSHIQQPDCLNNTLLPQGCVLGTVPAMGRASTSYIPRTEEEVRSHGFSSPVSQWSVLLMPPSNSFSGRQSQLAVIMYQLRLFPFVF